MASNLAGDLSRADFFATGTALGLYILSPTFSVGAGVGYDGRTGKVMPLPLGAIYWEPVPNFAIRGLVPAAMNVSWRPKRFLTLELTETLDGQRYHLSNPAFGMQKGELAYSLVKLGAGARFHFGTLIHLEILGGAIVRRRFEVFLDRESIGRKQPSFFREEALFRKGGADSCLSVFGIGRHVRFKM